MLKPVSIIAGILNKRFIVPGKWTCDSPRILDNVFGMKLCAISCRSMIGVVKMFSPFFRAQGALVLMS